VVLPSFRPRFLSNDVFNGYAVRTRRKGYEVMVNYVCDQTKGAKNSNLSIVHTNIIDKANEFENIIRNKIQVLTVEMAYCSPVLEAHAGPGALGLAWMNS
jgi:fatty acid-binding protein DegV